MRVDRPGAPADRVLLLQILGIAALVIGGFFYFEKIVGLVPCELCLRERWPWYTGFGLALLLLVWTPWPQRNRVPVLFAGLFLVSAALAIHHVLVEQHVIVGPTACTATGGGAGESVEELKRRILATKPVRCDEVQWRFAGVSLAGWNALASLFVVVLAGWRIRRRAKG